ncbi:MAG: hypothetical protein WBN65_08245 [Gammaproteobacteria bacterium]
MTSEFRLILIWLFAGTAGVFMAMNAVGGSFTGVEYLPVGNDSFYHARRILDAIADPSAFFEFDQRIHAPEGSWVPWPWLYDFMMAKIVVAVMFVTGASDPGPILAHIPVFWVYINVLLMILIARQLGLDYLSTLLAALGIALLPLTQALHATGLIDHHFVELTFILLATLGGLRWFADPASAARAGFLGFVLGIAPGFHNALFILQIPVLMAMYLCWSRGLGWSRSSVAWFSATLVLGTIMILLGSEPFWQGMFAYYYLSSFHLYVAVCTAVLMLLAANRDFSLRWLAVCGAAAVLMALPLLGQAISMGAFLQKDIARFDVIVETESLLSAIVGNPRAYIVNYYTLLLLSIPFLFVGLLAALIRGVDRQRVFFAAMGLLCLTLFFMQLRLKYFGICFLVLSPLLIARWWADRAGRLPLWLSGALLAFYGVAYAGPVINRIQLNWPIGLDSQYGLVREALPYLQKVCAEDPGVVLAYNDLGNYIRYHTECSVVANNFLLTAQHQQKIAELDKLFSLDINEFAARRPDIKYLLLSFPKLLLNRTDGSSVLMSRQDMEVINAEWPLMVKVLLDDGYGEDRLELIFQKRVTTDDDDIALVKLLRVKPVPSQSQ